MGFGFQRQRCPGLYIDDGLYFEADDLKDVIGLFLLRQLDFFFFLTPSFVLGCRDLLRLRRPCQAHGAPDHHGTRCASQVAARKNNACGVGIAYDSKAVIGSRITITDEATALTTRLGFIAAAGDRETTVRL